MGMFTTVPRPKHIRVLNVENGLRNVMVTFLATYESGATRSFRTNVKNLNSSFIYSNHPSIERTKYLGKVYPGIVRQDALLVFVAYLSDGTVDLLQEKEGSVRCDDMLALTQGKTVKEPEMEEPAPAPSPQTPSSESMEKEIEIPIEILPNLYSLGLSHVSLKRHLTVKNNKIEYDYVTLKCQFSYRLNGRKEGRRYVIFTGYDEKGGVVAVEGDVKPYCFTDAGHDFAEICFSDFTRYPVSKITVSVREI